MSCICNAPPAKQRPSSWSEARSSPRSTCPPRTSRSRANGRPTSPTTTQMSTSYRSSAPTCTGISRATGDVLGSIRDLDQWLAGIATTLKPGGTLLLYDSHPVTERVDPLGHWRDNYFESSDERTWRLEEVVDAVIEAGLRLTKLAEFQTFYKGLQRDRRVPWDFALLAEKSV